MMDFLKQELAPLTEAAWKEIQEEARDVLSVHLTGRKLVDVSSPKGLDYVAKPMGRLHIISDKANQNLNKICYGVHEVKPLIEIRLPFELDIWEMDNVERGAEDIELEPLNTACRQIAEFENHVIVNGLKQPVIKGLTGYSKPVKLKKDIPELMKALNLARQDIRENGIEGPFVLAIHPDHWSQLSALAVPYPLTRLVKDTVDDVIETRAVSDAIVISRRGNDTELTLGQDIAIGYQAHTSKSVELFLTESFTFHIYEPEAIQQLKFQ